MSIRSICGAIFAGFICATVFSLQPDKTSSGKIIVQYTLSDPRLMPKVKIPDLSYFGEYCIEPVLTQKTEYTSTIGVGTKGVKITWDTTYQLINIRNDSCYKFDKFSASGKIIEKCTLLGKLNGQTGNNSLYPEWRFNRSEAITDTVINRRKFKRRIMRKTIQYNDQQRSIQAMLYFREAMSNFPDFIENFWLGSNSADGLLMVASDVPYLDDNGNLTAAHIRLEWVVQPGKLNAAELDVIRYMIAQTK